MGGGKKVENGSCVLLSVLFYSYSHSELCKNRSNSLWCHVIRSGCAAGFKWILLKQKQKEKRSFLLEPRYPPKNRSRKKVAKGRRRRRRRGKSVNSSPLSPCSLRRRFLVLYPEKALLRRPSGDPGGRTFQKEEVSAEAGVSALPVTRQLHGRVAGRKAERKGD